jgi:hypothetical protein
VKSPPAFPMRPLPPAPAKVIQSRSRRLVKATYVSRPRGPGISTAPTQNITKPLACPETTNQCEKPPPSRQSALSKPPPSKQKRPSARLASKTVTISSSNPLKAPEPLSRKPVSTKDIRKDRLGTLVQSLATSYDESSSWDSFVTAFRGRSYLAPNVEQVQHPAAELLAKWRDEGVPALTSSEPWPTAMKVDDFGFSIMSLFD